MREVVSEALSILIIVAISSSIIASCIMTLGSLSVSSPESLSVVSAKVSGQTVVIYLYNFGEKDVVIISAYISGQPVPNFASTTIPRDGMVSITLQIPSGATAPYYFTLKSLEGWVVNGVAS